MDEPIGTVWGKLGPNMLNLVQDIFSQNMKIWNYTIMMNNCLHLTPWLIPLMQFSRCVPGFNSCKGYISKSSLVYFFLLQIWSLLPPLSFIFNQSSTLCTIFLDNQISWKLQSSSHSLATGWFLATVIAFRLQAWSP